MKRIHKLLLITAAAVAAWVAALQLLATQHPEVQHLPPIAHAAILWVRFLVWLPWFRSRVIGASCVFEQRSL